MRCAPPTSGARLLLACGLLLAGPVSAGQAKADGTDQVEPEVAAPAPKVNPPGAEEDAYPRTMGMAVFPDSRFVPIDGELSTGGIPLEAQVFMTDRSVDEVLSFYRKDLEARKLTVAEHRFGPHSGYVGYYHTKSRTMRLATVQTRPGGDGSMIVLSAMNPLPLLGKSMEIPEELPDLPSAINVVTTEQQQAGATHRTVYFEAWGTPADVLAKLDERARDKGWRPASKGQRLTDDGLTMTHENKTCIIRATAAAKSTQANPSSAVTMVVIEEDPKPTPHGTKPGKLGKGR